MNDRVKIVFPENFGQRRLVEQINPVETEGTTGDFPHPIHRFLFAVAEIVYDGYLMPSLKQLHASVAADIPRPARCQNFHVF
jgi:hypothetical protein